MGIEAPSINVFNLRVVLVGDRATRAERKEMDAHHVFVRLGGLRRAGSADMAAQESAFRTIAITARFPPLKPLQGDSLRGKSWMRNRDVSWAARRLGCRS